MSSVSEVAFKLRRELSVKAPALKAAVKAERELSQLKRQLQQLDIDDAAENRSTTWTCFAGDPIVSKTPRSPQAIASAPSRDSRCDRKLHYGASRHS